MQLIWRRRRRRRRHISGRCNERVLIKAQISRRIEIDFPTVACDLQVRKLQFKTDWSLYPSLSLIFSFSLTLLWRIFTCSATTLPCDAGRNVICVWSTLYNIHAFDDMSNSMWVVINQLYVMWVNPIAKSRRKLRWMKSEIQAG